MLILLAKNRGFKDLRYRWSDGYIEPVFLETRSCQKIGDFFYNVNR